MDLLARNMMNEVEELLEVIAVPVSSRQHRRPIGLEAPSAHPLLADFRLASAVDSGRFLFIQCGPGLSGKLPCARGYGAAASRVPLSVVPGTATKRGLLVCSVVIMATVKRGRRKNIELVVAVKGKPDHEGAGVHAEHWTVFARISLSLRVSHAPKMRTLKASIPRIVTESPQKPGHARHELCHLLHS
ncbi:hypothetical protein BDV98DRAFT_586393 [Pterulicium gracile]|uniref:Uncharacterized protein n=1 Tax=Pterulicium gracile TaxID=1884261 RepID=A0A5C3QD58_9AGAR|nr:hypothetical protein BDV98DRAFT_586393 [Pterula gracilis]